ncbi:MAG: hypothetical protein PHC91_02980 [Eubacteriales bacterium]|nr:hypothetical protein [Eubacteriales bacterium]
MKRNWTARLVVLVAVLTLITASLVSGTFAKYTTEVSGTDTVVVANWKADFGDGGTTSSSAITTFNIFDTTADTGVANVSGGGIIAPGTSGVFNVAYDTSAQVARDVKITIEADNLEALTYLKFYKGTNTSGDEITAAVHAGTLGNLLNESFAADEDGDGTVSVYWIWPFSADATQDAADTLDGINPITNGEITITFNATQADE